MSQTGVAALTLGGGHGFHGDVDDGPDGAVDAAPPPGGWVVAVEGLASVTPNLDALPDDPSSRHPVLDIVRTTEGEPILLGVSAYFLIAGRRPHRTARAAIQR
jgi:hypothetical protein